MSRQVIEMVLEHRRTCGEILVEKFRILPKDGLDPVSLALGRIADEISELQDILADPAWRLDDQKAQEALTHRAAVLERKAEKADEKLMKKLKNPNLFYERWV